MRVVYVDMCVMTMPVFKEPCMIMFFSDWFKHEFNPPNCVLIAIQKLGIPVTVSAYRVLHGYTLQSSASWMGGEGLHAYIRVHVHASMLITCLITEILLISYILFP